MEKRHEPTDECDGYPLDVAFRIGDVVMVPPKCIECNQNLCACEAMYGHDCEAA